MQNSLNKRVPVNAKKDALENKNKFTLPAPSAGQKKSMEQCIKELDAQIRFQIQRNHVLTQKANSVVEQTQETTSTLRMGAR